MKWTFTLFLWKTSKFEKTLKDIRIEKIISVPFGSVSP